MENNFGETQSVSLESIPSMELTEKKNEKGEFFAGTFGKDPKNPEEIRVNEDSMLVREDLGLIAVFDGAGGHIGAAQASQFVKGSVERSFEKNAEFFELESNEARDDFEKRVSFEMEEIIREANRSFLLNSMRAGTEGSGMTGTMVKMVEYEGQKMLLVGHVGDSRAYLYREGHALEQMTLDHDFILNEIYPGEENVEKARELQWKLGNTLDARNFSAEEKEIFQDKKRLGVSNAFGLEADKLRVDIGLWDVKDGDEVLVFSDGITDNLTDQEIENWVKKSVRGKAVQGLMYDAYQKSKAQKSPERSGKPRKKDDMSAIRVKIGKIEQGSEEEKKAEKQEGGVSFRASSFDELYTILRDEKFTQPEKSTGEIIAHIMKLELKARQILERYDTKKEEGDLAFLTRKRDLRSLVVELLRKKVASE